jgi:hypothetical protein
MVIERRDLGEKRRRSTALQPLGCVLALGQDWLIEVPEALPGQ